MVVPALGATAQHETMYWGITPDGEVRIVFESSGASGIVLSLRLLGPKLIGTARTFGRGGGNHLPEQSAPATLSSVSCFPSASRAG
jgi:hypothetical protein